MQLYTCTFINNFKEVNIHKKKLEIKSNDDMISNHDINLKKKEVTKFLKQIQLVHKQ